MEKHTFTLAYSLLGCLLLLASSCIKNDIPYARIQPNFTSFEVQGQDRGSRIDTVDRAITVYLPEETDPASLTVVDYAISKEGILVSPDFSKPLDLTQPVTAILRLYQDWEWTISANQVIERYFSVGSQVGQSVIDVENRTVTAQVSKKTDIAKVLVESLKLGPRGTVYSRDLVGEQVDFSQPVKLELSFWNHTETWTITVVNTDSDISTERVDAWTNVAWVYGTGEAANDNGVQYRMQGDEDWIRVPEAQMFYDGGSFHAVLTHLSAQTTYEARALSGNLFGDIITFTTGSAIQVPNTNLDEWWLDGKVWNPWAEGGERYWDTGNKGATTIGQSNSVPTDDTSSGSGWAAKLETRFVGISILGKLAAGNIFVGEYVRTEGTNGVLSFGRPFTERPTKLRGYFKYHSEAINYTTNETASIAGQPDTCVVWCALIDSDEPFEIRTNPKNRQLFDENGDYVVAYGRMQTGQDVDEYTPFEIELDYKSTSRVPKYILICGSASKYGDYFTGGSGSVLYLDDLLLDYDY